MKSETMNVRTNADSLTRQEMQLLLWRKELAYAEPSTLFFGGDRITSVRKMIVSDTVEDRQSSTCRTSSLQREDSKEYLRR